MSEMKQTLNEFDYYNLYIDGQWKKSNSEEYTEVLNPATEEIVAYVTSANEQDIDEALKAADKACEVWKNLTTIQRGQYLTQLVKKLLDKKEFFADILVREQGKTYNDALFEVENTASYLNFAIESATSIKGDILPTANPDEQLFIEKVPYGVVVGLCAWNYPLALVGRKLGPALITGNTMVLKPHELTPIATVEFFKLIDEVGFPKGVINLITGSGPEVGAQLVSSPMTKLITVTGSVKAGQAIYKGASQNIAGLVLELGGKSPFIVLEDADIDKAVNAAVSARYANCGQVCICCDMVFAHESIVEEFTSKLIEKVKEIKVGDPFDSQTQMGPKASLQDLNKIDRIVQDTLSEGASIGCGAKRLSGGIFDKGYWYEPTVLTNVTPSMTAAQEEIFGPVLPILTIKSLDDAASICNSSPYGLAAYVFTKDHSKIMKLKNLLDVGTIFINQGMSGYIHGFHSGHKLSGLGGEDGQYGIDGYLQKRSLYMNHNI